MRTPTKDMAAGERAAHNGRRAAQHREWIKQHPLEAAIKRKAKNEKKRNLPESDPEQYRRQKQLRNVAQRRMRTKNGLAEQMMQLAGNQSETDGEDEGEVHQVEGDVPVDEGDAPPQVNAEERAEGPLDTLEFLAFFNEEPADTPLEDTFWEDFLAYFNEDSHLDVDNCIVKEEAPN